jgi:hypothetical protein
MSRSLKVTHILLVAAFAAGLSACSGGSAPSVAAAPTVPTPSAAPTVPTPSATPTASASVPEAAAPSDSPSDVSSADPKTMVPEVPASATPSPSISEMFRGTDAVLLGQVKLLGGDSITVKPKRGGSQKAELTPFTVVLDVRGAICNDGEVPHKCNAKQMQKALASGKGLYAKVTIKDGLVEQVEEIVEK